jgi:Tfp pilus assembly PilM family ATPase
MPRLLALEWDDVEARVAIADVQRGEMVLEQAFSVSVPSGVGTTATSGTAISASGGHDLGAIGRRIGEALAARGIRRGKTLVAVGRANIELKNLTLPPAPPDELPEMVRFQAEREFNTLGDDWPLDFIPIPGESGEAQTVLAAAISPELIAEIETTCQAAGLVPQRLILRPCAAASLLSRTRPASRRKLRLLVDLVANEADLTVLDGDAVVFLRTTRLPTETLQSDPVRALLPEIRRTIAAVQNRFKGQHIEEIFLCGEGANQGNLALEMGRDLEMPAEVFNPLTVCTLSGSLRRAMPEHASRFAPLVGMLLDEAAGGSETIDFLNPRRKAQPRTWQRESILAGVAAAVLAIAAVAWIWVQLAGMDSEIALLKEQSQHMDPHVKQAAEIEKKATAIDKWLAGDIVWLDELAALATKLPPAQDVMLSQLTISEDTGKAPALKFNGLARNTDVDRQLQQALRDGRHDVTSPNTRQDDSHKPYGWNFSADMEIHSEENAATNSKSASRARAANSGTRPVVKPSQPAGTEAPTQ